VLYPAHGRQLQQSDQRPGGPYVVAKCILLHLLKPINPMRPSEHAAAPDAGRAGANAPRTAAPPCLPARYCAAGGLSPPPSRGAAGSARRVRLANM
jgi:hypothetical protein